MRGFGAASGIALAAMFQAQPAAAFEAQDLVAACTETWLADRETGELCVELQKRAANLIRSNTFEIKTEAVEKGCYIRNPNDPLAILRCLRRQEVAIRQLDRNMKKEGRGVEGEIANQARSKCTDMFYPDLATVAFCVDSTLAR